MNSVPLSDTIEVRLAAPLDDQILSSRATLCPEIDVSQSQLNIPW